MAWMFVGGEEGDLYLSYLDAGYLVISKGRTLHETVPLFNGKYWLRGVAKGDSMMIVCKVKLQSRRFRVQFYSDIRRSAVEQCEDCIKILSNHIPFKYNSLSPYNHPPSIKPQVHAEKITGEVTASQMVQAVTKEIELPRAYQHTNIPVNQIKNLLFLCLCDPNFPAFVRQVRKALHEME
ncbi:meiotic recombination protein REC114-like isoform X2 [Tachypleus tridentatus]|uniref:meiotic recombination protein REC114-like isoform X2 n=1 Tax=Tachypleus tridentatus TaxID=6853 RepID=UPI003FD08B0B